MKKGAGPEKQPKTLVAVIVAIIVIVVGLGYLIQVNRDTSGEKTPELDTPTGATEDYGFVRGDLDAPVKVVVYEDFACPACGGFELTHFEKLDKAVEDGKVSVESRLLKFLDKNSPTKYSSRAFNTYLSAQTHAGPEIAESFRFILFASQPEKGYADFTDDELIEALKAAQANSSVIEKVKADQKSLRFEKWMTNAADAASRAKVSGTPYVIVNGEVLDDPFRGLWPAVEKAASSKTE